MTYTDKGPAEAWPDAMTARFSGTYASYAAMPRPGRFGAADSVLGYVIVIDARDSAEPIWVVGKDGGGLEDALFLSQQEAERAALDMQNEAPAGEVYAVAAVTVPLDESRDPAERNGVRTNG